MSVVACEVPTASALGPDWIERADFRDAYRAPLSRPELGVTDIFHAIFAHRPAWMNALLITRNKAAAMAGLEVPASADILRAELRDHYAVGEQIGPWPIFALGPDELIAGRDNAHMDFRLSIMKVLDRDGPGVIVSTVCVVANPFGRRYLSSIIPFHKFGVRKLITNAVAARRL